MTQLMGVGEAARRLGVHPRVLTTMLYEGRIADAADYPIIAGRRVIPQAKLPIIRRALEGKGHAVRSA